MKNYADLIAQQMYKFANSKEMESLFSKYAEENDPYDIKFPSDTKKDHLENEDEDEDESLTDEKADNDNDLSAETEVDDTSNMSDEEVKDALLECVDKCKKLLSPEYLLKCSELLDHEGLNEGELSGKVLNVYRELKDVFDSIKEKFGNDFNEMKDGNCDDDGENESQEKNEKTAAAKKNTVKDKKVVKKVKCKKCRELFDESKLTEFGKKMYCKGCLKEVKKSTQTK